MFSPSFLSQVFEFEPPIGRRFEEAGSTLRCENSANRARCLLDREPHASYHVYTIQYIIIAVVLPLKFELFREVHQSLYLPVEKVQLTCAGMVILAEVYQYIHIYIFKYSSLSPPRFFHRGVREQRHGLESWRRGLRKMMRARNFIFRGDQGKREIKVYVVCVGETTCRRLYLVVQSLFPPGNPRRVKPFFAILREDIGISTT